MSSMRCTLLLAALVLTGCMTTPTTTGGTPTPPTPPQITVAQANLALSYAVKGTVDSAIACRQQNKCSADDTAAIENVSKAIATAGIQVDMELNSTDPWATQRTKILTIVTQAGVTQLKAKVSPSAQLLITSIITLFDSISSAVGGPIL